MTEQAGERPLLISRVPGVPSSSQDAAPVAKVVVPSAMAASSAAQSAEPVEQLRVPAAMQHPQSFEMSPYAKIFDPVPPVSGPGPTAGFAQPYSAEMVPPPPPPPPDLPPPPPPPDFAPAAAPVILPNQPGILPQAAPQFGFGGMPVMPPPPPPPEPMMVPPPPPPPEAMVAPVPGAMVPPPPPPPPEGWGGGYPMSFFQQPVAAPVAAPVVAAPAAAPAAAAPAAVRAAVSEAAPEDAPAVVFDFVFDTGQRIRAGQSGLLGRNPSSPNPATICSNVDDPDMSISKNHLEYGIGPQGLWIKDRRSTNGTELAKQGVSPVKLAAGVVTPVSAGDVVQIGKRMFRVEGVVE